MARGGSCPSPQQLLAFQLGDLAEPTLHDVAEHLETCSDCEKAAQQLDSASDAVLSALRRSPLSVSNRHVLGTVAKPLQSPLSTADFSFLLPPVLPDEIGRLGNYRVLRLLGKGGMAFVFHGEDVALRRPVALKVMKPDLNSDADGWQRFLREARIMAAIKHEHLVTVYQAGQEGSLVYLAMELLEGESLGKRLERCGAADVAETLRLAREITSGLIVVHRHGLVHRDVKPDNIWLEGPGARVKILDFGLARFVNDDARLTQAGTVMGTPAFMAPEQARAQPVDARSDLFSLGCVLYAICTGERPFQADNTLAALTALAVDNPRPVHEINPSIPLALSDLVMQLLAKDPDARPPSAEAVLQRLEQIPAMPATATSLRPGFDGPRRRRVGLAVTAALAAAAGVVVLGLLLNDDFARFKPKTTAAATPSSRLTADPAALAAERLTAVTWPAAGQEGAYLRAFTPIEQENWWFMPPLAPVFRDDNVPPEKVEDYPVQVRNKKWTHSFFMHPPPPGFSKGKPPPPPEELDKPAPPPDPISVSYRLGKKYSRLQALVSLNDGPPHSDTPLTFSIHGDGKQLWKSTPVLSQQETQRIDISVREIEVLKIAVTSPAGPGRGAHGVWVEPFVTK